MNKEKRLEKLIFFCSSGYSYFLFVTIVKKLDFFNKIKTGKYSIEQLTKKFNIKKRPLDTMIQLLVYLDCVEVKNGKIKLTSFSKKYLLSDSIYDLKAFILMRYNYSEIEKNLVDKIYNVLVTDTPLAWGKQEWKDSLDEKKVAEEFTKAMDSRGKQFAKGITSVVDLSKYKKLLDLGGSSGVYSEELVKKNKNLHAVVFDKAEVIKSKLLKNKKITFVSGDFFKDAYPKDCDVVLLSNVLHDWNEEENLLLLKRVYNYLPKKGLLLIYDGIVEKEDLNLIEHSIILMLFTKGRYYSKDETYKFLKKTNFKNLKNKMATFKRSVITAEK